MNNKKEVLQRHLARLKESLLREQQRLHGKINNIGWDREIVKFLDDEIFHV